MDKQYDYLAPLIASVHPLMLLSVVINTNNSGAVIRLCSVTSLPVAQAKNGLKLRQMLNCSDRENGAGAF